MTQPIIKALSHAGIWFAIGALVMAGLRTVDHLWPAPDRQVFICIQEGPDDYSCSERAPLPSRTEYPRSWPRGLELLPLEPRTEGVRMGQQAIHMNGRPGRRAGAALGEAA